MDKLYPVSNGNGPGLGPQYADFIGLTKQIRANVVKTSDGLFQEHPESMGPRVFVTVLDAFLGNTTVVELLQDGQAVVWPRLPDPMKCGFDYWSITTTPGLTRLANVNMVRQVTSEFSTSYPPSAEGEPDVK